MDWKYILTSFSGRLNRQPFWLGIVILMVAQWLVMLVLGMLLGTSMMGVDPNMTPDEVSAMATRGSIPLIIAALLFLYPSLAIYTKRWHDRNKSGWWTLILLVPLVGFVWVLVECGFLRGTEGTNRFGPDPLA
jgi:uncharacterized membrane protein YhaH (DUF805 family)